MLFFAALDCSLTERVGYGSSIEVLDDPQLKAIGPCSSLRGEGGELGNLNP